MSMNLFHRAGRNILFKAIAELISRLIYLVFFLFLARKLGDKLFGTFSFAFSFAGIFAVLIDPGLNLLLTREIAGDKSKAQIYSGVIFYLKLILSIITLILSVASIIILRYDYETIIIVLSMSLLMILNAFMDFQIALFNAFERMEYDAILKIINKVLVSVFGIVALQLGVTVLGVTNVMMIAMGISILFGFYFIKKKFFFLSIYRHWHLSQELLWKAFPIGLMMVFNALYFKIDVVLMSQLGIPREEIGWYAASSRIIEVLNVIPALIVGGLFPILSAIIVDQKKKMLLIVNKSYQGLLIVIIPLIVIFSLRASDMIHLLYGSGYANSVSAIRLLIWSSLFVFPNFLLSNVFVVVNQQKMNAIFSGCAVVVNIVLNFILISRLGFIGASVAAIVTAVALFSMNVFFFSRLFGGVTLAVTSIKPILSGLIMTIVVIALSGQWFICAVVIGICTYLLGIFLFRTFSKEEIASARSFVVKFWQVKA
jgi:O-antigen/teichoic acid export membrane protein